MTTHTPAPRIEDEAYPCGCSYTLRGGWKLCPMMSQDRLREERSARLSEHAQAMFDALRAVETYGGDLNHDSLLADIRAILRAVEGDKC